jgi:hypothetical protein
MVKTIEDFIKKYPEVVYDSKISIPLVADNINIYNKLKNDGDVVTIHLLKLDEFVNDYVYITRSDRQKKLERILNG